MTVEEREQEMLGELLRALKWSDVAQSKSPKELWEAALEEVRRLQENEALE